MAKEGLDARIGFRLPPEVADSWRSGAKDSGLSLSDWLRCKIEGGVVTGLPTPAPTVKKKKIHDNGCDPKLMQQLAKIGNNVNQIARALNECRRANNVVHVVQVLSVLKSLSEKLGELFPQLPGPNDAR